MATKILPNDAQALEIWNKIVRTALQLPHAKIDREEFLTREFNKYYEETKIGRIIQTTPLVGGADSKIVDKIAYSIVNYHVSQAAFLSGIAGLPGGWWAAAAIPADLSQFFYHVIQIIQKLAYLYGWQDLYSHDSIDDETIYMFSLFIGVAFGSAQANRGIAILAKKLAEQVGKRVPKMALTKYGIYNLAKQVAKWIGVSLTRDTFGKALARIVPLLGGIISGSITYLTMKAMGNNLVNYLSILPLATGVDYFDLELETFENFEDLYEEV